MVEAARRALSDGELRVGRIALPWQSLAQALAVCAVLAGIGFAEGGLLPRTWRLATIALLGLACAALVARPRLTVRRLDTAVLGAFTALVGWTALSAAWSTLPTASLLQAERVLVYAAALVAFLLLVEETALPAVLAGALGGITLLAGYGLARYVVAPPPLDVYEGRLLYQPFGYANALGIVTTIGIVLAVGLALRARAGAARAALAPLAVLVPALYFTASRGAWLALAVGLAVLLGVRGGTRAGLGALAVLVLAAAVAVAAAAARHDLTMDRFAGENRPHYWNVAVQDFEEHPWLGPGAGTYGDYWLHHRPVRTFTRTAHSLYLQSLAELGPLGLALVVSALGLPLVALRAGRRDPLVAAAAGAYAAYLVHTGVDWDWELPAVTLTGLVCGAALLLARRDEAAAIPARVRTLLLVTALVLGAVEAVRLATGPGTPFGV